MRISGVSSLITTRFRRMKNSNASWLGRSMEQLAVAGSSALPSSTSTLAGTPTAAVVPSSSTPSRARHRLATEPITGAGDETTEENPKSMLDFQTIDSFCA